MSDTEKFKITIRIADIPEFSLTILRRDEEIYRKAVKEINQRMNAWSAGKASPNSKQILSVITLQFAKQFYEAVEAIKAIEASRQKEENATKEILEGFEQQLDKILLSFGNE